MTDTSARHWDAVVGLKDMTARFVVPVLREWGYRGSVRKFTFRQGETLATMKFKLSRWNTKAKKEFSFELTVSRGGETLWHKPIYHLMPPGTEPWWAIASDADVDVVGSEVATALSDFACPAVRIVLNDPDPHRVPDNARTFPQLDPDWGRSIEDHQQADARRKRATEDAAGWTIEDCIARSSDPWLGYRNWARHYLRLKWPNDPRSVEIWLAGLEIENSWQTREGLVLELAFWPGLQPAISSALSVTSAEDESAYVRWAASYGMEIRERASIDR